MAPYTGLFVYARLADLKNLFSQNVKELTILNKVFFLIEILNSIPLKFQPNIFVNFLVNLKKA